ncbi:MAG: peptidoglycan editing factor PgeF [Bacteroidota bacterium]|nr:peptidoglycan editing factor PgeF [Candidatus Kapabacteria bacterium]MDW8219710.1 peptidoglycan editing factor PgeF [Bacteroidota bacterium]
MHIERPSIFPSHIVAGVTERNVDRFPLTGLSLFKAQILNDREVEQHRAYLAQAIGVERTALRFQRQVHGTRVRILTQETNQYHIYEPFEESDGMITQLQGVVLCVGIADCAGILLYDSSHNAVAALHSGWRGTCGNIVQQGITMMREHYGSHPSSLRAYVSPCASGKRYIVQHDVAQYFSAPALQRVSENTYTFDNRLRITEQLLECGVLPEHIEVSGGCTISDERYHSYRRDGQRAGRMAAFIGIMPY